MPAKIIFLGLWIVANLEIIRGNSNDGDPQFHLKPLGSHLSSSKVEEASTILTSKHFVEKYIVNPNPLTLKGIAKNWPARARWSDEYLRLAHAKLEMKLGGKRSGETKLPPQGDICLGRDTMGHFINTYQGMKDAKFIESELPTPLYQDVYLPSLMRCGNLRRSLIEVDFWLSSGSVGNSLQKSSFNKLTCVLNGTKNVKIISPSHDHLLYQVRRGDNDRQGNTQYSLVDGHKVDMKRFPRVAKIPELFETEIHAGDCLFVPSGFWSVEEAQGEKNLAVSFIFGNIDNLEELNLESCPSSSQDEELTLAQVDPDWKYQGHGRMSMGNSPLSYYMDQLNSSCFSTWDNTLKYDNIFLLLQHLTTYLPYADLHARPRTDELYGKFMELIKGKSKVFKRSMLSSLSKDFLREIFNEYLQPPIAENSCDYEFSFFAADRIRGLFEDASRESNGTVKKDDVIASYLKMGGHIKIISELWKDIAGEMTEMEYKESIQDIDQNLVRFHMHFWDDETGSLTDMNDEFEGNLDNDAFYDSDFEPTGSSHFFRDEL